MRLKTKLVLAISGMVLALVTALSYAYLSQLLRQRLSETYATGDFLAHQIYLGARQALDVDLSDTPFDPNDPAAVRAAVAESLQSDPGLASLLQSIVGYAPTVYDAAITDSNGVVLLHTDAESLGKTMRPRPAFAALVQGGFWRQLDVVYGAPKVYEVRLPLKRGDAPFGDVRVGLSTVFLKNELRPQLQRTATFAGISILVSLALTLLLSSFALRPLEDIGESLDLVTLGQLDLAPESASARTDEVGVVTTKIARLGRQIRNVQEVFSALKENLDQIMANLQDGLLLFTQDTRVVLVSASAERFVGRPRGEMLGRRADEIFTAESRLGQVVGQAFQARQPLEQREIETEDGRRVQVSLDFIEERGQGIGALLTMRDAESVRRIEDEIELSRRLAAIGRLTSGVAHEVKNPINAVLVHLEVLREKLQAMDPESRRHMDIIAGEIQRLDRVVQTLVDFTRPVELRLSDLDLRRTVEEVALLASPDASRQGVSIQRELPPEPLTVKADTDLLKQALLNIVLNGVQAMPQGGALTIRGRHEGGSAVLEVQDQGSGIPADVQEKVFNLYFTTKQGGSGIGLAMTYRVMQLHNGAVDFESQDGRGTTFRLRFPAAEARKEKAEAAPQQVTADS